MVSKNILWFGGCIFLIWYEYRCFFVFMFLNKLKILNKIEIGKYKLRVFVGEGKKF